MDNAGDAIKICMELVDGWLSSERYSQGRSDSNIMQMLCCGLR